MKSDIVEVEGMIHVETLKAYLFSTTGDKDDAVWIPKSQCEKYDKGLEMPERIAVDKGLV